MSEEGGRFRLYNRDGKSVLCIKQVTEDDDGEYMCQAINKAGRSVCYAELVVEYQELAGEMQGSEREVIPPTDVQKPPVFVKPIGNCETAFTGRAVFECRVSGQPVPDVKWFRRDHQIEASERISIEVCKDGVHRLTIVELNPADASEYKCLAVNPSGQVTCSAQLKIMQKESKDMETKSELSEINIEIPLGNRTGVTTEICIEKPRTPPTQMYTSDCYVEIRQANTRTNTYIRITQQEFTVPANDKDLDLSNNNFSLTNNASKLSKPKDKTNACHMNHTVICACESHHDVKAKRDKHYSGNYSSINAQKHYHSSRACKNPCNEIVSHNFKSVKCSQRLYKPVKAFTNNCCLGLNSNHMPFHKSTQMISGEHDAQCVQKSQRPFERFHDDLQSDENQRPLFKPIKRFARPRNIHCSKQSMDNQQTCTSSTQPTTNNLNKGRYRSTFSTLIHAANSNHNNSTKQTNQLISMRKSFHAEKSSMYLTQKTDIASALRTSYSTTNYTSTHSKPGYHTYSMQRKASESMSKQKQTMFNNMIHVEVSLESRYRKELGISEITVARRRGTPVTIEPTFNERYCSTFCSELTQEVTSYKQEDSIPILRDQEDGISKSTEELTCEEPQKTEPSTKRKVSKNIKKATEERLKLEIQQSREFKSDFTKIKAVDAPLPTCKAQEVIAVTPTEITTTERGLILPSSKTTKTLYHSNELSTLQPSELVTDLRTVTPGKEQPPSCQISVDEKVLVTPTEMTQLAILTDEHDLLQSRAEQHEYRREGSDIKAKVEKVETLEPKQKPLFEGEVQEIQIDTETAQEQETEAAKEEKVTFVQSKVGEFEIVTPLENTQEVRTQISPTRKQSITFQYESGEVAEAGQKETLGSFAAKASEIKMTPETSYLAANEMGITESKEIIEGLSSDPLSEEKIHPELTADELQLVTVSESFEALKPHQLEEEKHANLRADELGFVQPVEIVRTFSPEEIEKQRIEMRADELRVSSQRESAEQFSVAEEDENSKQPCIPKAMADEVALVAKTELLGELSVEPEEKVEYHEISNVPASEKTVSVPVEVIPLSEQSPVCKETVESALGKAGEWGLSTPMEVAENVQVEQITDYEQTKLTAEEYLLAIPTEAALEVNIPLVDEDEEIDKEELRESLELAELEVVTPIEKVEWLLAGIEGETAARRASSDERVVVMPFEKAAEIDVQEKDSTVEMGHIPSKAIPAELEIVTPCETAELQYEAKDEPVNVLRTAEADELAIVMPTEKSGDLDVTIKDSAQERRLSVSIPQELELAIPSEMVQVESKVTVEEVKSKEIPSTEQYAIVVPTEAIEELDIPTIGMTQERKLSLSVPQQMDIVTPGERVEVQIQTKDEEAKAEEIRGVEQYTIVLPTETTGALDVTTTDTTPERRLSLSIPQEMEVVTPSEIIQSHMEAKDEEEKLTEIPDIEEYAMVVPVETTGGLDVATRDITPERRLSLSIPQEMELVTPSETVQSHMEAKDEEARIREIPRTEEYAMVLPTETTGELDVLTIDTTPERRQSISIPQELELVTSSETVNIQMEAKDQEEKLREIPSMEEYAMVVPMETTGELDVPTRDAQQERRHSISTSQQMELATSSEVVQVEIEDKSEAEKPKGTTKMEEYAVAISSETVENIDICLPVSEEEKPIVAKTAKEQELVTPTEIATVHLQPIDKATHVKEGILVEELSLASLSETVEDIDVPSSDIERRKSTQLMESPQVMKMVVPSEAVPIQCETKAEDETLKESITSTEMGIALSSEMVEGIDVSASQTEKTSPVIEVSAEMELVAPTETAQVLYKTKDEASKLTEAVTSEELAFAMPSEVIETIDIPSSEAGEEKLILSTEIPQEVEMTLALETVPVAHQSKAEGEKLKETVMSEDMAILSLSEIAEDIDISAVPEKLTFATATPLELEFVTPSETAEFQSATDLEVETIAKAKVGEERIVVFPSEIAEDMDVGISMETTEDLPTLTALPIELEVVTPTETAEFQYKMETETLKAKPAETGDEFVVVTPSELTEDLDIAGPRADEQETGLLKAMPEEVGMVTASEVAQGMQYSSNRAEATEEVTKQQGEEFVLVVPIEMMWIDAPLHIEQIDTIEEEEEEELEMASPLPRVIIYEGKEQAGKDAKPSAKTTHRETETKTAEEQLEFQFDFEDPEMKKAVVKIQSAFRGYNIRKSVKAPEFTKQLSDHEVTNGSTVHFECHVKGIPTPEICWMRNGKEITESERLQFTQDDHRCLLTIHGASQEDDGMYTCQATNKVGTTKTSAELVVEGSTSSDYETAPSAEESPSRDSPVEELQKREGMPMPVVQIDVEEVTAPELTMKLQNLVIERGEIARLMCGVTGIPKPTVTWFFGGRQLKNEGRYRIYEESSLYSLEISDCQYEDTGEYIITASNAEGQVYCAGDLMVKTPVGERRGSFTPPTFTVPLKNVTVVLNNSARFDCQVSGVPEPEIIWFHNGIGIHEGDNHVMETTDEGVCSLIVVSADKSSGGEYSCVATNTMGRSSCSCRLVVKEVEDESREGAAEISSVKRLREVPEQIPPEFIDKPKKQNRVLLGKTARISCTVKGSPSPSLVWFKGRNPLRIDSHYQLHVIGNTRTLLIPTTDYRDAGEYTCAATNASGAVYCSTILYVDDPESTTSESEDVSQSETELAPPHEPLETITEDSGEYDSEGSGKYRNLTPVAREIRLPEPYPIKASVALLEIFPAVPEERVEEIHVSAPVPVKITDVERKMTHQIGTPTLFQLSKEQALPIVKPVTLPEKAPRFVKTIDSVEVTRGSTAKLVSMVQGAPDMMITWYKNGEEVEPDGHHVMELDRSSGNNCLVINDVNSDDEGRYTCMIANSYGQVACSAFLRLEGLSSSATDSEHSTSASDTRISDDDKDKHDKHKLSLGIGEELFHMYKVTSDFLDESNKVQLKSGDQVDILDSSKPDKWLVRNKEQPEMIGYIPTVLLQRQSSVERSAAIALQEKMSDVGDESQPGAAESAMKPKAPFRVSSFHRDSAGSDSSEAEDTKSAPESFEIYMAVADYTPDANDKEDIPLVEGQHVDVLDSNSAIKWLVRTKPSKAHPPKQGWVRATYLEKKTQAQYEGKERLRPGESPESEAAAEFSRMERADSKELEATRKKTYALEELLATERQYVKDIKFALENHLKAMESPNLPASLQGKKDVIFMNLEQIYEFHSEIFMNELENCNSDAASIGRTFIKWQPKFEMHVQYCKNKQKSEYLLSMPPAKTFFEEFGKALGGDKQLSLSDYLIKPVQRITKYQLLLKEIVKYSKRAKEDYPDLELALNLMMQVPKRANDLMHLSLIEGYQGNIDELGRLFRKDQMIVWDGKPRGKGKDRQIFLFQDLIMFTKIKKESKLESPGYIYKSHMILPGIGMTEDVGDDRRFELWYGKATSTSLQTLQAKTIYVKQAWVKEIRDILSKTQQELLEIKAIAERKYGKSTDSVSSSSEASFPSKPSPIPLRKFAASLGRSESLSSGATTPTLTPQSPQPRSPTAGSPRPTSPIIPGFPSPEIHFISVGEMYTVTADVIAEGGDEVMLTKGTAVKVIARGSSNMYKIQTTPTDNFPSGQQGYVPDQYLKKAEPKPVIEVPKPEAPKLVEKPKSCTVMAGQKAGFTCKFKGVPKPEVEWFIQENVLLENRMEITSIANRSTLTVYNVKVEDAGKYKCVVENSAGLATGSAHLHVQAAPTFIKPLKDTNASEGTMVQLKCIVSASPEPDITWYKDGNVIIEGGKYIQDLDQDGLCTLTITDVHAYNYGDYTCRAANLIGEASCFAKMMKPTVIPPEIIVTEQEDKGREEHVLDVNDFYDIKYQLARGKFCKVHLCTDKISQSEFVAKFISYKDAKIEDARRELQIMKSLLHVSVVSHYESFESPHELVIIMEHVGGGKMLDCIVNSDTDFTEEQCVFYVKQICRAVDYVHHEKIVHLNIEPGNILCVDAFIIKLADFGNARRIGDSITELHAFPEFISPEVIRFEGITPKSDMWSIGVLTYMLLSGITPFCGNSVKETFQNVLDGKLEFEKTFEELSPSCKDFLSRVLCVDASERNSCGKCLKHPWLSSKNDRPLDCRRLKKLTERRRETRDFAKAVGHDPTTVMAECAPQFKVKLVDTPVVEGDTAMLSVVAEGNPEPEVTWFYSEEEGGPQDALTEDNKRIEFENLADGTCILTIKNAVPDDIGFYTCKLQNTYGSCECTAELGVEDSPFKE
ncbi:titin homolog isoform X2 [Ptychodera flava]|uniref:titin homolog isoform X2 n=1 Tax=Ptychodera flava TaxID=63121 RepID=UPI00396A0694